LVGLDCVIDITEETLDEELLENPERAIKYVDSNGNP
jgi:hypothetical protein